MIRFFSPLVDFYLLPSDFSRLEKVEVTKDIRIIPLNLIPDLTCLSSVFVPNRINQYKEIAYWLCIETTQSAKEVEEIVNLFQITLWIVKRSRVNIHFISNLHSKQEEFIFRIIYSRFIYNPINITNEFSSNDLNQLSQIFQNMFNIFYNKSRLKNAIIMNYDGCIVPYWEAAYLLYSTTFESLLTYGNHKNLVEELAKSYAALLTCEISERDQYYEDFREIYRIRSDIIHGSSAKYRDRNLNLNHLAKISDMLRIFWTRILTVPDIIDNLDKNDKQRKKYLKKIIGQWKSKKTFYDKINSILKIDI